MLATASRSVSTCVQTTVGLVARLAVLDRRLGHLAMDGRRGSGRLRIKWLQKTSGRPPARVAVVVIEENSPPEFVQNIELIEVTKAKTSASPFHQTPAEIGT